MATREIRLAAGDDVKVLIEQADGGILSLNLSLAQLSAGAASGSPAPAAAPAAKPDPAAAPAPAPAAPEPAPTPAAQEPEDSGLVAFDLDDDEVMDTSDVVEDDDHEIGGDEIELDGDDTSIDLDDDLADDGADDEEEEELPAWTGRARDYQVKAKAAEAPAAPAAPAPDEISLDGATFDDEVEDVAPSGTGGMTPGNCSVFLTPPRTPEKRQAAAQLIMQVQGVGEQEAMDLTKKVIIKVADGVSEFDAETVLEQVKAAGLLGRITRSKK